jgi:hypothetical protein
LNFCVQLRTNSSSYQNPGVPFHLRWIQEQ